MKKREKKEKTERKQEKKNKKKKKRKEKEKKNFKRKKRSLLKKRNMVISVFVFFVMIKYKPRVEKKFAFFNSFLILQKIILKSFCEVSRKSFLFLTAKANQSFLSWFDSNKSEEFRCYIAVKKFKLFSN